MFQEQFFEGGVRTRGEEVYAARLAVLAQALDEILNCLLVGFKAVPAEGDFLRSAGFLIDQAQISISGWGELLRSQDLNNVHVKAASNQRAQTGLVAGRVEEIA